MSIKKKMHLLSFLPFADENQQGKPVSAFAS